MLWLLCKLILKTKDEIDNNKGGKEADTKIKAFILC